MNAKRLDSRSDRWHGDVVCRHVRVLPASHGDKQRRHATRSGFTLVEVLLSIGILGVGMAMVAAIFPVAAKEAQDSNNTVLGGIICDNAVAIAKGILSGGQRDVTWGGDLYLTSTAKGVYYGTMTAAANSVWQDLVALPNGTFQTYNTTTITDSSQNWPLDTANGGFWVGYYLEYYGLPWNMSTSYTTPSIAVTYNGNTYVSQSVTGNVGKYPDQNPTFWSAAVVSSGRIVINTNNSVQVIGTFNPMPGAGSLYRIVQPRAPADSGIVTTAPNQLGYIMTDATKTWSANQWAGWSCYFRESIFTVAGAGYFFPAIPPMSRYTMKTVYPPMLHTDEANVLTVGGFNINISGANAYQLVLLADENQFRSVICPNTLHYPCGYDSTSTTHGTSRGCLLFTTKPVPNEGSWNGFNPVICRQPGTMGSADGSLIITVAYSKSSRNNLAAWAGVMVTSVANTNVNGALVPVVTINPGISFNPASIAPTPPTGSPTLCAGSPLVFVETGAIAKITQVLPGGTTAVLDSLLPMPRGAAQAMALVVQEVPWKAGDPYPTTGSSNPTTGLYGPFSGTPLPVSPAIAWKVSQTGAR
jgi:prepilin-type N-terminal cleavage/methylation domain-containing protein